MPTSKSQIQSVKLLVCVSQDVIGKRSILTSPQTVALCLLCVRNSSCRKVKINSYQFLQSMLNCITVSEAEMFMECNSDAMSYEGRQLETVRKLENRVSSPKKKRTKSQLWNHFDVFINWLSSQMEDEGQMYIEITQSGIRHDQDLTKGSCDDQMSALVSLIECCISLCTWPLPPPGTSHGYLGDIQDILGINLTQLQLSNLNHYHVMVIWEKVGNQIMVLFKQITKQILTDASQSTKLYKSSDITQTKTEVVSSSQIQDMKYPGYIKSETLQQNRMSIRKSNSSANLPQTVQVSSSDKANTQQDQLLTVRNFTGIYSTNEDTSNSVEPNTVLESLHPKEIKLIRAFVKLVFILSVVSCQSKREMLDSHSCQSGNLDMRSKTKCEFANNKMAADKNTLRHFLMKEDIFPLLTQLAELDDDDIKTMSFTILRLFLKPVELESSSESFSRSRSRREMAGHRNQKRPQVHKYKHQFNKDSLRSGFVLDLSCPNGLGSDNTNKFNQLNGRPRPESSAVSDVMITRPSSASILAPLTLSFKKEHTLPRSSSAFPQAAQPQRTSFCCKQGEGQISHFVDLQMNVCQTVKNGTVVKSEDQTETSEEATHGVPANKGQNPYGQYHQLPLLESGQAALKDIFSSNLAVRKSSLHFLHDLVQHSQTEFHMKLSKLGCVPKLLDFLRINDEDELGLITGLTITRMLVSSDGRLCQLFHMHGGPSLLMALSYKSPSEKLKQAIAVTFSTVNKAMQKTSHQGTSGRTMDATDIWGQIMHRWEGEDNVVKILTQFL